MKKFMILTLVLASVLIGMFTNTAFASVEQPISFLQGDPEWGSKSFTITGNRYQNMSNSGCGPTAASMVVNYYADDTITPVEIADYTVKNGYRTRSSGTAYGLFGALAEKYDVEYYETFSSSEAYNWMTSKEDPLIICSMGPGNWTREGHYILLWKVEGENVFINDPGSTDINRTNSTFKKLSSQAKRYFCYNRKPKSEITITEKNGEMVIYQEFNLFPEEITSRVSFSGLLENLEIVNKNTIIFSEEEKESKLEKVAKEDTRGKLRKETNRKMSSSPIASINIHTSENAIMARPKISKQYLFEQEILN